MHTDGSIEWNAKYAHPFSSLSKEYENEVYISSDSEADDCHIGTLHTIPFFRYYAVNRRKTSHRGYF